MATTIQELIATNFSLPGQTEVFRGEVRDVYKIHDKIVSISTDRLSVFGHIFPRGIPYKGQVVSQITAYFADITKDIVPNWIESSPDPNVLIGKQCKPFPVNMIIRGSMVGHVWRIYEAGQHTICGVELPDGLQEYDILDEPIITPTTKTMNGYEEDITAGELIAQGIMTEDEYERLSIICRQLFIRGKLEARKKGLLLADSKYEFGTFNDEIYLIDEIHSPDSSRYFALKEYEDYAADKSQQPPEHLSREWIRLWLLDQGYSGLDDQTAPELTDELVIQLSERYISLYEALTGMAFLRPETSEDPLERIERVLKNANI
jgi:phosphoribosylaminoimidazole-succinocarboxamide synthase